MINSTQARHTRVAQLFNALYRTAPADLGVWSIYPRRPCLSQRANELRGTVMPRLRKLTHMCSSTVSDTANRLRKTRKKKIPCRTSFRSGHMSAICARLGSKGKVGVQRGRETAGVPSFLPPPRARRRSRRPQTANPPLRFSEKLPARQGRTRLRQFEYPAQPVLRNAARIGRTACAPRASQRVGAGIACVAVKPPQLHINYVCVTPTYTV